MRAIRDIYRELRLSHGIKSEHNTHKKKVRSESRSARRLSGGTFTADWSRPSSLSLSTARLFFFFFPQYSLASTLDYDDSLTKRTAAAAAIVVHNFLLFSNCWAKRRRIEERNQGEHESTFVRHQSVTEEDKRQRQWLSRLINSVEKTGKE